MSDGEPRVRITRRLRFRLTANYLLFFTLLFGALGAAFYHLLGRIQDSQVRQLLDEQWLALVGYLRIRGSGPVWVFNQNDPNEVAAVERLRRVFFLADSQGQILEVSPGYRVIGVESPAEIRAAIQSRESGWRYRPDPAHVMYLLRWGVLVDAQRNRPYYVAIGRSFDVTQPVRARFLWIYMAVLPLFVCGGSLFGWYWAGRALRPINNLVEATQRITGTNLSLRIPASGTGDELDRLINTLNQMIERLEKSFRHMRQFTADVSHELRTPITAVRGQLEVALYTARTVEQYREAIMEALEEVERLTRFVHAMLSLSQAESGQLTLHKEAMDVVPILKDITGQFQIPADESRVQLSLETPPHCVAELDRVQFERLVTNLLANAVKFTPPGGEVRVRLSADRDKLELVVEDTGCGIPAEYLPHVFDRLYRVPGIEGGPEKGLGLGLSFVSWIVKAHAGSIRVASTVGKGTRFIVTLPLAAARAVDSTPLNVHPA
ncbi:MAG TPA: ATP-binding protein [Bryobacteraceae bacterium]|nr:ATP-binding protein [Bryobacteraceae bacterium]